MQRVAPVSGGEGLHGCYSGFSDKELGMGVSLSLQYEVDYRGISSRRRVTESTQDRRVHLWSFLMIASWDGY